MKLVEKRTQTEQNLKKTVENNEVNYVYIRYNDHFKKILGKP